jgi:starch synthase
VVASAVGGIPEVVVDGETGLLVPHDPDDPEGFARDLAAALGALAAEPARAAAMGRAGRERVLAEFDWPSVGRRTSEVYLAAGR